jgi:SAM-dependent methyltransferase
VKTNQSFEYSARFYDLIYKEKNYEKETAFVEDIFKAFTKPKSILEIGCGTGNYTQILHRKGYEMTGLDISENMIKVARKKCDCNFVVGDVCDFSLSERFDACVALFAVMGYVTENSGVKKAFTNIHRHLKPNGLFVFDVWNGLAVLSTPPELRVKEFKDDETKVLRIGYPKLKALDHVCEIKYKLLVTDKTNRSYSEFEEGHTVRFYFPQELKLLLEMSGFEVLKMCPFLDLHGTLDQTVWNTTVIARAINPCPL